MINLINREECLICTNTYHDDVSILTNRNLISDVLSKDRLIKVLIATLKSNCHFI